MSETDPPALKAVQDADALLRAFVGQPVSALPPGEAMQLREQVIRRLEPPRGLGVEAHGPSGGWRPWLLFAAAACLPVVVWASVARFHAGPARRADAARVTSLAGPVEIAQGPTGRSIAGTEDAPLGPGDELRTGQNGSARASLPNGAVVEVGPEARMRFSATSEGAAVRDRVELVAGRIQVRVPKLPAGDELRVQTADATVVVHGTKFSVERIAAVGDRPDGTRVSVTEGIVTVDTDQGRRTLTAGMDLVTPEVPEAPAAAATPASAPASAPDEPSTAPGSTPRSTLGAENALLAEAMRLRRARQDDRAVALIDAFVVRYPGSPLMETARIEQLHMLEESGAMDRLGHEAERYLADYPRGYARQEASRMLAVARAPSP
jgi:FecR protein